MGRRQDIRSSRKVAKCPFVYVHSFTASSPSSPCFSCSSFELLFLCNEDDDDDDEDDDLS